MGENELEKKIRGILTAYDLFGVIYADTNGKNPVKVGKLDELPEQGLIQILFGGEAEINSLLNSLNSTGLPQGWGQGRVRSYIDITKNGNVFGVFNVLKEDEKFEDLTKKMMFMKEIKKILENYLR